MSSWPPWQVPSSWPGWRAQSSARHVKSAPTPHSPRRRSPSAEAYRASMPRAQCPCAARGREGEARGGRGGQARRRDPLGLFGTESRTRRAAPQLGSAPWIAPCALAWADEPHLRLRDGGLHRVARRRSRGPSRLVSSLRHLRATAKKRRAPRQRRACAVAHASQRPRTFERRTWSCGGEQRQEGASE